MNGHERSREAKDEAFNLPLTVEAWHSSHRSLSLSLSLSLSHPTHTLCTNMLLRVKVYNTLKILTQQMRKRKTLLALRMALLSIPINLSASRVKSTRHAREHEILFYRSVDHTHTWRARVQRRKLIVSASFTWNQFGIFACDKNILSN